MGNTVGRGKKAKVMKINGEMIKLKTPVRAGEVVKDYPAGYVLLESDAVKHYGIRAKPLEPQEELKPKKVYFLVELPKFPEDKEQQQQPRARRVRSGINMTAKDRLECLMLSRRAVSDLEIRPRTLDGSGPSDGGPVRVKVRLPKAQVQKLMQESKDGGEVAEKIIDLYMENSGELDGHRHVHWKPELGSITESFKGPKKRVSFVPDQGEIHLDVASH
ncbi:hypothetical protein Tsubulata_003700 [Turnera subulata]|uniref:Uncharacterized protein n=1 Tax=Turnera subulata TaxID=218843 RepID=A0A9Q0JPF9_9ROSI|nr:hypothetical protein Tsubulata_003700 [Turnera subulata]